MWWEVELAGVHGRLRSGVAGRWPRWRENLLFQVRVDQSVITQCLVEGHHVIERGSQASGAARHCHVQMTGGGDIAVAGDLVAAGDTDANVVVSVRRYRELHAYVAVATKAMRVL